MYTQTDTNLDLYVYTIRGKLGIIPHTFHNIIEMSFHLCKTIVMATVLIYITHIYSGEIISAEHL